MSEDVDQIIVVGGGLAGAGLVRELLRRGVEGLAWIDAAEAGRGSEVPCALVHPFAGRSFQPRPGVFEAWVEALRFFEAMAGPARLHRAALRRVWSHDEGGARLRRSWTKWREVIEKRLGSEFVVHADGSSATYGPVFAFEPPGVMAALTDEIRTLGVEAVRARVVALDREHATWAVHCSDGGVRRGHHVVVAAGPGAPDLLGMTDALELFAGTLMVGSGSPLPEFVVDGGHVASSMSTVACGATYRHFDAHPADSAARSAADVPGLQAIVQRFVRSGIRLPTMAPWTGARVVDRRARRPWVETCASGLHAFTAFGSQGGLWVPAAIRHFADTWCDDGVVPRWLSPAT